MQKANLNKTIAGIATPPGNSGVGIVRISGPQALDIAKKMFTGKIENRLAVTGTVYSADFSDNALAIYFQSPKSFTGEDTVEFQCHGGWFLLQKVLAAAAQHGAAYAEKGEFSRQAFLNDKMSLDQAEAIIDIINAESDLQLKNANLILGGGLKQQLLQAERTLIEITAQIEATMDYPEHDIEHTTADEVHVSASKLLQQIKQLTDTAHQGRIVSHGINVAVLGKPNVGKSSIFNALLNSDRSIITEIAGTTTDTITESINYNGVKIIFHDTAGIRTGANKIEKLGIERSKKAIDNCDVALAIFDASTAPEAEDTKILDLIKNKPHIIVLNKTDLPINKAWKIKGISASALKNKNIDEIKKQIYDKAISTPINTDKVIITNKRHLNELTSSAAALENALEALGQLPLDCIASDINTALAHIGNITGTHASEAVLDEIFSRFCLGK